MPPRHNLPSPNLDGVLQLWAYRRLGASLMVSFRDAFAWEPNESSRPAVGTGSPVGMIAANLEQDGEFSLCNEPERNMKKGSTWAGI